VEASAGRPLAELLSALSERSPAPGAGSAAAWAAALACALLEMTSAFAEDEAAGARARVLGERLLALGDEELSSYEHVLSALKLQRHDPTRDQRLKEALASASEPPLAVMRAATEVAELAAEVAAGSRPSLAGDAIAGVLLAEAASQAAGRLVEVNLEGRRGDQRLDEVARLRARAARTRERVFGYRA
jgi:methenyltetrahydrofolate cyclohydrolase